MISSTHKPCNECQNSLACGDQGECLALVRQRSRKLLDQLTPGERFMLMFGRGVIAQNPLRVVPVDSLNDEMRDRPDNGTPKNQNTI